MDSPTRTLRVIHVGRRAYAPVLELQESLVEQRKAGEIDDSLVLVEHDPVYTLGRQADENNVIASAEELRAYDITIVRTGRGGDVTYHGPGQLVGYPIFKLSDFGKGPGWYVEKLEETLIRTLETFDIEAGTDEINRGVWVRKEKIAAIGVRITRHVTMHGFALNVSTDLAHYAGIVPCGIHDRGVTSMHCFDPNVDFKEVQGRLISVLAEVFGFTQIEHVDG
jgi:lipoyl(octanoyl) transferase